MRDYYLKTWYIPVALPVAERLITQDPRKLENIRKVPKPHTMIAQPQAPRQNKTTINTNKEPMKNRN